VARFKVKTVHFVEAPNWDIAETLVEQGKTEIDQITSEAASEKSRDIIAYGIAKKIFAEHNKIFFDDLDLNSYEIRLEDLQNETREWLRTILEEVIQSNELTWE